eukprot:4920496-Prymnesium_polylepis.1
MSEVHTSRSEFDTLRHLLSFVYDADKDIYERISVWANAADENDTLAMPTLAGRFLRESERAKIFGTCDAAASEDGLYMG